MSVQANYTGQLEHADNVSLSTTAQTAVLSGEDTLKTFAGCSLINTTGSAVIVSLYRYDGSTSQRFWRGSVAANATECVDCVPVPLHQTTEEIRAEAATGSGAIEVYPIVFRQDRNVAR